MVPGLEPVSELARDLAVSGSIEYSPRHHRVSPTGRPLVDHVGSPESLPVGRHGAFDEPGDAFNGYTVGRAMQLLADAEAAP